MDGWIDRQTVLLRQLYQYVHVLIFQETGGYSGSDMRLVWASKKFDALENHIEGKKYATSRSERH